MAGECTRDLTVFVQVASVEIQSKRSGLYIDSAQFVFKFPAQYFQIEKKNSIAGLNVHVQEEIL